MPHAGQVYHADGMILGRFLGGKVTNESIQDAERLGSITIQMLWADSLLAMNLLQLCQKTLTIQESDVTP